MIWWRCTPSQIHGFFGGGGVFAPIFQIRFGEDELGQQSGCSVWGYSKKLSCTESCVGVYGLLHCKSEASIAQLSIRGRFVEFV